MPHTLHSHVTNVLWSAKPVSKVNTKKLNILCQQLIKRLFFFFFWLVLFLHYIVFEGKFYIWQTKWTLGQQLIVSIISLLDMHPLCFPIGQQGLRLFSLSTDPQGLGMAKKLTHLCYPGLWLSKAGPGMGQNLPLLLFSQSSRCIDYFDP